MKKNIDVLKSYFEKGDRPTQEQFENLIDSFLHKDDGVAVKEVSENENGDFVFVFSDGTDQIISQASNQLPDDFLESLQKSLDAKLESSDVTEAARTGLEIRDGNGQVQFTADEYVEIEGATFDPANNRIKFNDAATTYYYVHSGSGDDDTGAINDPSRPYHTIDGVFANYDKSVELPNEYIVIILVNQATHEIREKVPFLNVEFRSNLFVNISFTPNTNSGNLFFTNNGSSTIRWYFNIPNGRIIDNKTTGFSSLNTEDLICHFNVNEINITSPGGNARYFGRTFYVEKINRLIMRSSMGLSRTKRLNFEYIDARGYTPNAALLIPFDSEGLDVTTRELITGDVGLIRIVRSGKIAFSKVTGNLRFHYSNSPIIVEFLDTPEATILLVQTVTQVTFTGRVKLLNFTGNSTNGAIDFINLVVDDSTGLFNVDDGNLNYKNCSIVTDSYLMRKSNVGTVKIDNTTIRQKNPTELINSTGSGITIDVGGFSTNATDFSNNANDTIIQDFIKNSSSADFSGIEVRNGNGVAQFTIDEFVEFDGVSFDATNKKIATVPLTDRTVYVDPVNGNDATAVRGSAAFAYQTYGAAYDAIPTSNITWIIYLIGESENFVLDRNFNKPVKVKYDGRGVIDFSSLIGRLNVSHTINIDAPNATLKHESATASSFRNDLLPFYINVKVLDVRTQGNSAGASTFFRSSSSTLIKAQTVIVRNNSGSGRLMYFGQMFCGTYNTSETRILSEANFVDIEVLILAGQSASYSSVFKMPHTVNGSGDLVVSGTIDISNLKCAAGIDIILSGESVLTGVLGGRFLGNIKYGINSVMKIINFNGRITPASNPTNQGISGFFINSKISLSRQLYNLGQVGSTTTGTITIENCEIIQDTPDKIVHVQNGSLDLNRAGYIRSNATSLGDVVQINSTLTEF